MTLSKETAQELISKVAKDAIVNSITPLNSGYHSRGYKVITKDGKEYFIKQFISNDRGFEFLERKLHSLLVSHSMNNRNKATPQSYAVIAKDKDKMLVFKKLDDNSTVYEIQEYGGNGKSLLETFSERLTKNKLDVDDLNEIEKVTNYIAKIHAIKHPGDKKTRDAVYNDFLRSVIGHPEYTLQLMHSFEKNDKFLPPSKQGKYLELMLKFMHEWKNRGDRLCALHGDFWVSNAIKRSDKSLYFIDYSRMPWGDPGFDVGFWTSSFYFQYTGTKNKYCRDYIRAFMDSYIKKTGDKEILKTMIYAYTLIGIMYASEYWIPGLPDKARRNFMSAVKKMMKKKEFIIP